MKNEAARRAASAFHSLNAESGLLRGHGRDAFGVVVGVFAEVAHDVEVLRHQPALFAFGTARKAAFFEFGTGFLPPETCASKRA